MVIETNEPQKALGNSQNTMVQHGIMSTTLNLYWQLHVNSLIQIYSALQWDKKKNVW